MEKVRDLLNGIGLGMYADKFEEEGWDDIDTVIWMTQDDIRTCIDKPGHVRKLFLKLRSIIKDRGLQEEFEFTAKTKESYAFTGHNVSSVDDTSVQLQTCSGHVQQFGQDDLCEIANKSN